MLNTRYIKKTLELKSIRNAFQTIPIEWWLNLIWQSYDNFSTVKCTYKCISVLYRFSTFSSVWWQKPQKCLSHPIFIYVTEKLWRHFLQHADSQQTMSTLNLLRQLYKYVPGLSWSLGIRLNQYKIYSEESHIHNLGFTQTSNERFWGKNARSEIPNVKAPKESKCIKPCFGCKFYLNMIWTRDENYCTISLYQITPLKLMSHKWQILSSEIHFLPYHTVNDTYCYQCWRYEFQKAFTSI